MKRLLISMTLFFVLLNNALADEVTIEKSYTIFSNDHRAKEKACIRALREQIVPEFRDLELIKLSAPIIIEKLATYPTSSFHGPHGDAEGVVSCLFDTSAGHVTDISVSFVGKGLGGFEKRGRVSSSKDPADWKVISYSVEITS